MVAPRLGAARAVPLPGGCRRPQSASATAAGGRRHGGRAAAADGGMDETYLRALLLQGDGSLPSSLVQKLSDVLTEGSSADRGALMTLLKN